MLDPDTAQNLAAGSSGSALAAWLARATGWELLFMFLGGSSAAWFLGPLVAEWFRLQHQASAVGFAVGFLSLMVARKIIAVIDSFPADSMGGALAALIHRWLGNQKKD